MTRWHLVDASDRIIRTMYADTRDHAYALLKPTKHEAVVSAASHACGLPRAIKMQGPVWCQRCGTEPVVPDSVYGRNCRSYFEKKARVAPVRVLKRAPNGSVGDRRTYKTAWEQQKRALAVARDVNIASGVARRKAKREG